MWNSTHITKQIYWKFTGHTNKTNKDIASDTYYAVFHALLLTDDE